MILVDGRHEYDYSLENDNVHTLRYSDNGSWTYPKEIAMQVVDDGNGLVIKFREKNRVDYSEAEMLLIILKLINKESTYELVTEKEKL